MSKKQIEWVISKSKPLLALLMVESNINNEVKPLHPLAQSLLREFENISLNNLPTGFSHLKVIQHQINLLSSAPLPNKPTYRCHPNKWKEL